MAEPKVCFFSHSREQFTNQYELRDWLDQELRRDKSGRYLLKKAPGLGDLGPGSIVFFHFKGWVVGCAVVEQAKRATTSNNERQFTQDGQQTQLRSAMSIWLQCKERGHEFFA